MTGVKPYILGFLAVVSGVPAIQAKALVSMLAALQRPQMHPAPAHRCPVPPGGTTTIPPAALTLVDHLQIGLPHSGMANQRGNITNELLLFAMLVDCRMPIHKSSVTYMLCTPKHSPCMVLLACKSHSCLPMQRPVGSALVRVGSG